MSAADLTLAQEFKRRAEKALPGRIVRVMLYGSRARGDARPDSDWDVAIFLDGPPTSNDRRVLSDIGFDLMMEYGNHVQTVGLIERTGRAPKTHGTVIGQFSQLTKDLGEKAKSPSRAFNRAEDMCLAADYIANEILWRGGCSGGARHRP